MKKSRSTGTLGVCVLELGSTGKNPSDKTPHSKQSNPTKKRKRKSLEFDVRKRTPEKKTRRKSADFSESEPSKKRRSSEFATCKSQDKQKKKYLDSHDDECKTDIMDQDLKIRSKKRRGDNLEIGSDSDLKGDNQREPIIGLKKSKSKSLRNKQPKDIVLTSSKTVRPLQELPPPSSRKSLYRVGRKSEPDDTFTEVTNTEPVLRCTEVTEGIVLFVDHPQTVSIQGKALLNVIAGEITMYGASLSTESSPVKVTSPTSHSLISFSTTLPANVDERGQISSRCRELGLSKTESKTVSASTPDSSVVLILKKCDNTIYEFLTKLHPYQTLFGKPAALNLTYGETDVNKSLKTYGVRMTSVTAETIIPVIKIPEDFISVGEKWMELVSQTGAAKILTCGGKNSGKSTFNKFLVNYTLNTAKQVCYLDCDIGQTELNPPGCVALHILEEPIFGPPFANQRMPYFSCFYGPVTPSDNPSFYSNCVRRVFGEYQQLDPKPPLIINTMGWNKGLGVNLLVDTCHMVQPDLVIQLDSMNQVNNFPAITPEFVKFSPGWNYNRNSQSDEDFHHTLMIIDSPVVPRIESQLRYRARELRELSTLAYFSKCLDMDDNHQMEPVYEVPWKYLALHTSHMAVAPTEILSAINASIVALCVADISKAWRVDDCPSYPLQFDKTPVCQCLGFGIVRGINRAKEMLYLVTPVDYTTLIKVNTLIRGSSNIPDQILLRQKSLGISSGIPYVDFHRSVVGASSVRPRRYMPRRGRTHSQGDP